MFKSNDNITETSIVTLSPNENGENVSNVSGNTKENRNGIHAVMFYMIAFGRRLISFTWSTPTKKKTTIMIVSMLVLCGYWLESNEGIINDIWRNISNQTTHQTVQIDHKSLEQSILTEYDINQSVYDWNVLNPKHTLEIVDFSTNIIKVERVSSYTNLGHKVTITPFTTEVVIFEGSIDCKGNFQ